MTIKDARMAAGLSRTEMSRRFEIPLRTLEAWDAGDRTPPAWAEKLIVEKLLFIAEQK
jgi:DNA-binding transcriptional regulator YiaG